MFQIRILLVLAGLLPAMLSAAPPRSSGTTVRTAVPSAPVLTPIPGQNPPQTIDGYGPVSVTPPLPAREFRGAWLVTVANKDWPSQPGLGVAQQKAELTALLDRAVQLKLNAIVFQVRPSSDAVYASSLEPWSEYLTGTMGRAPQPFYDPLAFAIQEAHRRGLELHAWFNPFRALHPQTKSPVAPNHISRTHPEYLRRYGPQFWLDPGDPAVRAHVLRVVLDVVQRYDVDGVQFDDYFYPYPEKDAMGRELEFPDGSTWQQYGRASGFFNRDDWRRANVNQFVHSVYQSIKALKPWVKFGISPFGIWRPMNPPQIRGLDAYAKLYADSRLWLASGWLDYFAPQLYWAEEPREQSFPALLSWWVRQNPKGRHLWPGLNASNVGEKWSPEEIDRQIKVMRTQPAARGEIFYHLRSVTDNPALTAAVRSEYAQTALVPASPWLDSTPPEKPRFSVGESRGGLHFQWATSGGEPVWLWVVQFRISGIWTTDILTSDQRSRTFFNSQPEIISISAVDRTGNLSLPAVLGKGSAAPAGKAW
ncbi:MAG: family 10 glycosylhydrolase [Verrucomicrobiia bacterium]